VLRLALRRQRKNLSYPFFFKATRMRLQGDVTRLLHLANSLSNAVKFTEAEKWWLCRQPIQDWRSMEGDYEIHFAVKDTGIGISEDRMERLLKSF